MIVGWLAYTGSGTDRHGNAVDVWSPAVDLEVQGWAPTSVTELLAAADRTVTRLDLFVDAFTGTFMDKIAVPGEGMFSIEGKPQNFNNGPFGYTPGLVLKLVQVDG